MILSSFALKIIAVISMFCDHFGYAYYRSSTWLNIVGRLAFPIFAWQITIGADKTKDEKKYVIRLLINAIISQPIFMLFIYLLTGKITNIVNILFPLLFGVICICIWKKNETKGFCSFIICAIFAELLHFDYGFYGIFMIMIFYLFRDNKKLMILFQALFLIPYVIKTGAYIQIYSLLSLLAILLYNGKKGKNIKYFFYVFYPVHLLFLDFFMMIK